MLSTLEGLIAELRTIGVPVSTTETIDAAHSMQHVDVLDRAELKAMLASTLVKSHEHQLAFDTVFDLFFSQASASDLTLAPAGEIQDDLGRSGGAPGSTTRSHLAALSDPALRELLITILGADDELALLPVVVELVDRHTRIEPGQPVAGTFHVFRTFRAVDPDDLRERLTRPVGPDPHSSLSMLQRRLSAEKAEQKVERLRQAIESEVRRRLVLDRGAAAVARSLRNALPEDVEFLTGSTTEVEALQAILAPLPGQLAGKLAQRRRRGRNGHLDFRRTVRASMSTGGVPVRPVFRRPHPSKPELIVLADISGSVATFARFTLQLAHAMRTQFRSVRSFVFIDGIDEVTDVLADSENIVEAAERIDARRSGIWLDGRSDYGHALSAFRRQWGDQVSSRSIVLVLGDARSNYRAASPETLAAIRQRASRVYWLNPEHIAAWDDGDSVMSQYAVHCDGVFECRNVRQLKKFIEQLD